MATVQKRIQSDGKISYRVMVRLKGHPMQSATFDRLTDARRWGAQTGSAIREGRHFKTVEAKKHTLSNLIDRYLRDMREFKPNVDRDQRRHYLWWKKEIGCKLLSDITPPLIVECRDKLIREKTYRGILRTKSTANRYLAALSHAFTVAQKEWGWVDENPLRKVSHFPEPRGRVRYLDDDERVRLLDACKNSEHPNLYMIMVLALSTGARRNEILGLSWKNVDLDRGEIILYETKNKEIRKIPLVGHAHELIKAHSKVRRLDTNFVFASKGPSKPTDIRYHWDLAVKQAGIQDFRFHDLRHSCASYLAMGGASITEIGEILGHKTLQMVSRYSHLSQAHTSKVLEKMNEKIFG